MTYQRPLRCSAYDYHPPRDRSGTVAVKAEGAGDAQRHTRALMRPVARRCWQFDLQGFERLPADGPAILCPNHISFLDSAFLMMWVDRNISFVGKAEYMDSWKTKYLFPAMGMIPIDRSGGSKSQAALDAALEVLHRGELFGIFPEGTRSRDGFLYKGRTGAARLAMEVGCPIFPVGITGTDGIHPPDAKLPKLGRECTIQIGRAIKPQRYAGRGPDHVAWRSMIDEVMYEIREMTGQTYKNVYAGQADTGEESKPSKVATVEAPAGRERELLAAAG
jgi:1-acyl-sn-glycerol-3-phosphate acyltransferase